MNRSILPCRFLSTRSFPIRIAAAVAVLLPVLPSLRAAPPDAPPADTTIITALTPRQARELAGLKTRSLVLDGVTDLDADTAAAIAAFPGVALHLNGLRSLDPNTAAALATFPGTAAIEARAAEADAAEPHALGLCWPGNREQSTEHAKGKHSPHHAESLHESGLIQIQPGSRTVHDARKKCACSARGR